MTALLKTIPGTDVSRRRVRPVDDATMEGVRALLAQIESGGDTAVRTLAARFGDVVEGAPLTLRPDDLAAALGRLPAESRAVLERTADRIRRFAQAQRDAILPVSVSIDACHAGHTLVPVESAGCYAPGGRFPLPSSVLMTAITARVAGVDRVWVASPRPTDATLAAASLAGADGVLAIGGVQAIASMALGLVDVPACDMIVGPGNRWVTAAKFLVSDRVGIDMLAGPSELLVLGDDTADATTIAADLLAQGEHDDDALPILVTTDAGLVGRVNAELARLLESLPTAATARASLRNGYGVVARDMAEAITLVDRIGPEHLEIHTRDASQVASLIRNAGGVFIGPWAAEVLGDYGAGPNHVLPTGGTSRFRAGLSVSTFLRARTWVRCDPGDDHAGFGSMIADAAFLARMEGLEGHARSAEHRRAPT